MVQPNQPQGDMADPDMIDLRGILLLLRRQLQLIALTAAVILGLALIYLVTATPLYTARTLVIVDPSQRNLLETDPYRSSNAQADSAKIESEVEILRSPATALAVIEAAGLVNDPEFGPSVGFTTRMKIALGLQSADPPPPEEILQGVIRRLQTATSIRRLGLTYLIAIDITSADPARAAEIANLTAQTYIRNQVEDKVSSSLSARDILQNQAEAGRAAVAASDEALDQFIEENLVALEADAGNPRIAEIRAELEAQRNALLAQEVAANAAETDLQARNYQALADRLADEALNELVRQREEVAAQLAEAATGGEEELNLRAELAQLEGQLDETAGQAISSLRGSVSTLNTELGELRTELRTTLLQSDLSSESLARIFELQQAASIARSQYQSVLARLGEVENQAAVQVADSRVVSEALPPSGKSSPNTRLILALALVAGTGLGVGLAFLNEYYIGGIVSPAQLSQLTGIDVAAVIPKVSDSASAQGSVADIILNEPLSIYAESVRKLRAVIDQDLRRRGMMMEQTNLLAPDEAQRTKPAKGAVIMVTSSVPAEGKSTLSLSLARVYALAGARVILVDADLRKPSLATLVGKQPDYGLIDFLTSPYNKDVTAKFRILDDTASPLHLLLGTGRPKIPTDQLVSSPAFGTLMDKMRDSYDVIIVDTSPLLPVVDARYVAYHADVVIIPVRWAATSQSDLRSSIASLRPVLDPRVPVHLVLNQNEQTSAGYGYAYRYGGYYGDEEG